MDQEPLSDRGAQLLARAEVDEAVFALRPDYCAVLMVAENLSGGPSSKRSEEALVAAESGAVQAMSSEPLEEWAHVAQWREAYRSFGAKPQRTRNSLEALTRRAPERLPRINLIADTYNAISVAHRIPVGGEDLDAYVGPPRLIRATGGEDFRTVAGGEPVVEHPNVGEVVWVDDAGVTCRRWNWRQCTRTQLSEQTTNALFIFDALAACGESGARDAAQALLTALRQDAPSARFGIRTLSAP